MSLSYLCFGLSSVYRYDNVFLGPEEGDDSPKRRHHTNFLDDNLAEGKRRVVRLFFKNSFSMPRLIQSRTLELLRITRMLSDLQNSLLGIHPAAMGYRLPKLSAFNRVL